MLCERFPLDDEYAKITMHATNKDCERALGMEVHAIELVGYMHTEGSIGAHSRAVSGTST
jgi:hypothetical protein